MALTFSLVDTWENGKRVHVSGTITATGNYVTGGDTLDLSQVPVIASAQPPIQGTASMDGLAGFDYVFFPGAAMNSNKVKMLAAGATAGAAFSRAGGRPLSRGDHLRHDQVLRDLQKTAVDRRSVAFTPQRCT
jgi:hypothetical protein